MAHELYTNSAGKTSMAYLASGGVPWHSLGQAMLEGMDRDQWMVAAGFDFAILPGSVSFARADGSVGAANENTALYRSDTGDLLSIMGKGYVVHQPQEILGFFTDVADRAGLTLETAGVLKGGRQYWAMARTGASGEIAGDDHCGYILLSTSCDGSLSTTGQSVVTRVVCANTLRVARGEGADGAVRMRHTKAFDSSAMHRALGTLDLAADWAEFRADMERLGDVKVTDDQSRAIFAELLRPGCILGKDGERRQDLGASDFDSLLAGTVGPRERSRIDVSAAGVVGGEGRAIRGFADLLDAYHSAPGACPGTGYGVMQGVSYWTDHVRGGDDDRLGSAWFGQGATVKSWARSLIGQMTDGAAMGL